MSVESLQEIEALREVGARAGHGSGGAAGAGAGQGALSREVDATAAADVALLALDGLYAKVREAVAAEVATARDIFPRPAAVLAPLVHRVIEQRVGEALDAVLPPPPKLPPPPPATPPTPAQPRGSVSLAADQPIAPPRTGSPKKRTGSGSFGSFGSGSFDRLAEAAGAAANTTSTAGAYTRPLLIST